MKRYLIYLLFLLLVPFMVHAEVKITNVELVDKSNNLTAEEHPDFAGLNMDLDINFKEVNQYAKYKVTIKNDTKTDYQIETEKETSGEYISYEYELKGNTIKANSTKEVLVKVNYIEKVANNLFRNGIYTENNNMVINLSNVESSNQENPKTADLLITLVGVLLVFSLLMVLISKHQINKATTSLLVLALLIPLTIKALESIKLTITTNISIDLGCYRMLSDKGSYSETETIKEICINFDETQNDYSFTTYDTYSGTNPSYFSLRVAKEGINENTKITLTNTTTNQTIAVLEYKDMIPKRMFDVGNGSYPYVGSYYYYTANARPNEVSVSLENIDSSYVLETGSTRFVKREYKGPWITDESVVYELNKLEVYDGSEGQFPPHPCGFTLDAFDDHVYHAKWCYPE